MTSSLDAWAERLEERAANCWKTCTCGDRFVDFAGDCDRCPDCTAANPDPAPGETAEDTAHRERVKTLRAFGVPRRYALMRWQPVTMPTPAGKWADLDLASWDGRSEPFSILLGGPTDSGKTSLAAELLFQTGRTGAWIAAHEITSVKIHDPPEYRRIRDVPVLVVDELGRGHDGGAFEIVRNLIASRLDNLGATILTTNMRLKDLEQADASLFRRLVKDGAAAKLNGSWRDRIKP